MNEIVMGLHWTPAAPHASRLAIDLDALCVLIDAQDQVIEVISPSHPRTATDSVVHTGNSHDGANDWDDERIFVFLQALPAAVSQVAFCVHSASGQPFSRVPGARCHLSDARREQMLATFDLNAHGDDTFLPVFRLHRQGAAWQLSEGQPDPCTTLSADVLWRHAVHRSIESAPVE